MEKQTIAAFDFDGTITKKDTLIEFIRFSHGNARFLAGFAVLLPVLLLFKTKLIANYKAKQIVFAWFYKGWTIERFNYQCHQFIAKIDGMLNPDAIRTIDLYKKLGVKMIIVTASIENWVQPWAKSRGIETVLGTIIELENGVITGRFLSQNCYGQEKVNRILQLHPERTTYILEAYGDSRGDKELLAFADSGYFRKFNC